MKRFAILLVLVVFVFALLAETNEIKFVRYHVQPRTLVNTTYYDYMNGSYDGFPLRIQGDDIEWGGIYYTFMVNPQSTANSIRRQHWAFTAMDGNISLLSSSININNPNHQEGFGSLAIDPKSGNPVFAWHAYDYLVPVPPSADDAITNLYFFWDHFAAFSMPGYGESQVHLLHDNNGNPADVHEHRFLWPVVHIGPSPVSGKNRLYVFSHSNARTRQVLTGENPFMPSSSVLVSFVDFDYDNFDLDTLGDLVWTKRTIDYLERMHNWDTAHLVTDNLAPSARTFMSYAVAPEGTYSGYVALAGYVTTNSDYWAEWTDLEPHDHIVLLNRNYGEGEFEEHGFYLRNEKDPEYRLAFNPEDKKEVTNQDTLDDIKELEEGFFSTRYNFQMAPRLLNHKTMSFDRLGRLHFPTHSAVTFQSETGSDDGWYWYPDMWSVNMVKFDTITNEIELVHILPQAEELRGHTKPLFNWDMDDDGFVDLVEYPDGGIRLYDINFPLFYHQHASDPGNPLFNYNQLRMSLDNNGHMAMMWIDSSKAKRNFENPAVYPDFNEKPEIMISISRDSGANWSIPFRMNYRPDSFPDLSSMTNSTPAYVYPADRLILLDDKTVRLYFLYVDDFSWGSWVQRHGTNDGAAIRMVAIDLDIDDVSSDRDTGGSSVKPITMLTQNYPNPFNPSTNIRFYNPKNGNVKLNIYNVRGQLVNTLVDGFMESGNHSITWNGVDNNNRSVASGVYFYKLDADGKTETKRMVLMK